MDFLLVAAVSMIILHRADGGEVGVIPSHVTAVHAKPPPLERNKVVHPDARCAVWLDDGKVLSVLETCDVVKKLMEEATGR